MDDDDLVVTISGPALSVLLYENARCQDQIGFLLGEIQIFVTKKVTDSDRAVEKIRTHINIKSIVAHPMGCEPFFNTTGQLDEERLKEFLQKDISRVVGWYHYRYNFKLELNSLRDRVLHTDLSKFFSNLINLQKRENFLFFLMVTSENETHATHKFKHVLYRKEGKDYKPVSFRINNLGADASRPDGSDYKLTPQQSSCRVDSFQKVYDAVGNDLRRVSGVQSVQVIEKGAETLLAKLVPEVNRTDKLVTRLSEQLFEIRHNFLQRNFEKILLTYQMQQCSMEVDTQPASPSLLSPSLFMQSESISPGSSPLMFDPPQISPSSGNIRTATKKNLKQESSDERRRDPISSDRETSHTKLESPMSPVDTNDTEWKSVSQRRDEYLRTASPRSSFDKNVRKSSDYNSKNS